MNLDTTEQDWVNGLNESNTIIELQKHCDEWMPYVPDAKVIVDKMDERLFKDFKTGLAMERRGEYAGDNWAHRFSPILLPELMLVASQKSIEFHVPLLVALKRLEEIGYVKHHTRN